MSPSKNEKVSLFLPKLYTGKVPAKSPELLSLLDVLNLAFYCSIDQKLILISYSIVLITLLWCAQTFMNADLMVSNRTELNSRQKVFQQTVSHSIMTRIIASSSHAKRLIAFMTTQCAINKDHIGINEDEGTDQGYLDATVTLINDLEKNSGPGSTKIYVKDPESRLRWARGFSSSIRSTWCATVVYSPNKLITSTNSLKTLKSEDIDKFLMGVFDSFFAPDFEYREQVIPTFDEIITELHKTIEDRGIEPNIDDSAYGEYKFVNLDQLMGFTRFSANQKILDYKKNLPDAARKLKSRHIGQPLSNTNTLLAGE